MRFQNSNLSFTEIHVYNKKPAHTVRTTAIPELPAIQQYDGLNVVPYGQDFYSNAYCHVYRDI